ncbi:hypothetical protein CMI37_35325 [Candidatus Pacearchaeota archaeon]|nr:hypothetical protein [Candidatus Pacearchaeota archaeon]|tara:strand:- start:6101 stop:6571 length:471 start_codon:yes stop_codon:yes gene_type:complete
MRKELLGLVCIFALLFSLGFVSARTDDYKEFISVTKYHRYGGGVTKTVYADYDNENRFSTYDYRHGYSYRTSRDYWDRHYDYEVFDNEEYDRGWNYQKRYNYRERDSCLRENNYLRGRCYEYGGEYSAEYSPYLKKTKIKKCYSSAPRGKLFYTKC